MKLSCSLCRADLRDASQLACLHLATELPGAWLQEVYLSLRLIASARGAPPQPPAHSHFTLRCVLHRLHAGTV